MVFTPPPSPLPPPYPTPPPKYQDNDSDTESLLSLSEKSSPVIVPDKRAAASADSPNPPPPPPASSSSAKWKRRILVFLVPAVLLLVGSSSSMIMHNRDCHSHSNTTSPNLDDDGSDASNWREFVIGHLRNPDRPPAPTPHSHPHLSALSKHMHGSRLYGLGSGHRPTLTVEHAREEREGDGDTFPEALAAAEGIPTNTPIKEVAQETAPAIPTPAWPLPTPFPEPFDSSLSYNFTTSTCLAFFEAQIANTTFRECRPFGLLFSTSSDFFGIESNLTELTAVLEGTCNTDQTEDSCVGVMDWMADQMLLPSVCKEDLANENNFALEAIYGFRSYKVYRDAGCLVNPKTNAYCFAESLASSSPSDLYYYSLPLGTPIPGTTNTTSGSSTTTTRAAAATYAPSCSTCVSDLMSIFAPYASDTSLLLGLTYPPAAAAANKECGTGYAPGPETVVASPTPPVPTVSHTTAAHTNGAAYEVLRTGATGLVVMGLCIGFGIYMVL